VFTDDDVTVDAGWLQAYADAFDRRFRFNTVMTKATILSRDSASEDNLEFIANAMNCSANASSLRWR
jgi:hypothetical protein